MTTLAARPVAPRPHRSRRVERARVTVYDRDLYRRVIVDNFAGFGGAGHGIQRAAGRPVDVAINHCPLAIEYHTKNSPGTLHLCSSVWEVDPENATGGRGVALAWFSPDCRHFSRAKGAPKVDKRVRSLAWVVIKWATRLDERKRPDVIILENVREFETWGPLVETAEGTVPDAARKGETFRRWWRALERAGYTVDKRVLDAADFGAPTHRKRLFIIARRDGKPIRWPEATHGNQTSSERSRIRRGNGEEAQGKRSKEGGTDELAEGFGGTADGSAGRGDIGGNDGSGERRPSRRSGGGGGHRELRDDGVGCLPQPARGSLKPYRTAAECIDWSLPVRSIFERPRPLAEKTQRRIAMGIWRYLINSDKPFLVRVNHGGEHFRGQSIEQPLGTVTQRHGYAVIQPTLVSGYSEREGQDARARDVERPIATVPASSKHALAAVMLKHYGGVVGHGPDRPLGTVTSVDHHSLLGAALVGVGGRAGCSPERAVDRPMGVVTTKADTGLAAVSLARFNHGQKQWNGVDEPLGVVTSQGNKFGLVYAFLMKYYSSGESCAGLERPLPTVTTKDRIGLVTVLVELPDGQVENAAVVWLKGPDDAEKQLYLIADIGLRMLTPRELARAQGFPDSFVLPPQASKAVRLIGNSVPPPLAEAIVRANFPEGIQ